MLSSTAKDIDWTAVAAEGVMADVIQHRVLLPREPELTSRGAAVLALRALGAWASLDQVPLLLEEPCEPDRARADVYRGAMRRQRRFYETLIGHEPEVGARIDQLLG